MTSEVLTFSDLDNWLAEHLGESKIELSGALRQAASDDKYLKVLELGGQGLCVGKLDLEMPTLETPPQNKDQKQGIIDCPVSIFNVSDPLLQYKKAVANVLTAAGFLNIKADPSQLFSTLMETKRVRFVFDTNAMSNGVAHWLVTAMWQSVDVVTSAVVEREIHQWKDRISNIEAYLPEDLKTRTNYSLARHFLEKPAAGVSLDRMDTPEQSALLISQQPSKDGKKTPNADILLVEHARSLIRGESRNTRTIYVTGDFATARTAVGALGEHHVLLAITDWEELLRREGQYMTRGWWKPGDGLGNINATSLAQVIDIFLSLYSKLQLKVSNKTVTVEYSYSFRGGCPTEWVNPHYLVTTETETLPAVVVEPHDGTAPQQTGGDGGGVAPAVEELELPTSTKTSKGKSSSKSPKFAPSLRLHSGYFFSKIQAILYPNEFREPQSIAQTQEETDRAMYLLGILTDKEVQSQLRTAWERNDLDWFHRLLLNHPGYSNVMHKLSAGERLAHRDFDQIRFARAIGQVTLSPYSSSYILGSQIVPIEVVKNELMYMFNERGKVLSVHEMCSELLPKLHLTPYRFEKYLNAIMAIEDEEFQLVPETGGSIVPTKADTVVVFDGSNGHRWKEWTWEAFHFGMNRPIRFLRRTI